MTSGVGVVGGFLHDDDLVDDRKRTNDNTIYPRNIDDDDDDDDDDDTATAIRSCNNHNINLMHQQLLRAVARGNLQSVRRIVESISSSEDDYEQQQRQRRMLINHAEIWTETPPSSSSSGGGKDEYNRAVRPREATTTTTTESGGGIQLGELGYTFRKQFAAGWFTGTVVRIILPPLAHTRASSIATNDNDTTTKKEEEDGGSEGGGGVKKHDDYYRRCVYTDGDSEDLTVEDIIQLVKADPNNNKSCSSSDNCNYTTTNVVKEEKAKDEGTNNNNDNDGFVMSNNNNNNNTSSTSSTVIQQLEWYDITPLTLAVMRGHDDIVEYLLRLGADPTLMGYPKNQLQHPDNYNNKAHNNIMDAYVAASRLCKMIRRCRRTQDLLLSVKPFWKKASYYGSSVTSASAAVTSSTTTSSSNNKLRTEYTNVPIHTTWMLNAIDQVPRMVDYPLPCLNYDESMFDMAYWKTKMCDYTKVIKDNKLSSMISTTSTNNNNWVEVGQSRRCSSCREYKPVQSYYKNEKKKGTLARCISCVATNPETLDLLQLHDNNNNNSSSSRIPPISTSHATPVTSSSVVEVLPIAGAADGNSKINITQSTTTVEGIVKLELDNYSNLLQNNDVKRRKLD